MVYQVLDKDTIGIEILPHLSVAKRGFQTKSCLIEVVNSILYKNISANMQVVLKDKQTNTEFDLGNGQAYTFSLAATSNESRFSLIFRSKRTTTSIDNSPKTCAKLFVNAANQITIIAPEKSNYEIYNALGQIIESGILTNTKHETRRRYLCSKSWKSVKQSNHKIVSKKVKVKEQVLSSYFLTSHF